MFKRAKQSKTFEDIVQQIQEAILLGSLKDGDKLPNERKLREIFGVSRGTLREALRTLEQKGLIGIKTGASGGAFVCSANTQQFTESLDLLLRFQKVSLEELAEFRETVEGLLAEKAAKKAKGKDIKQLSIILESMRNYLNSGEADWEGVMKEDKRFHLCLANISGNRIFESILCTIHDNMNRYYERFLPKDRQLLEQTYKGLNSVLQNIKKRSPSSAAAIMRKHIRQFGNLMEWMEQGKGERGKQA